MVDISEIISIDVEFHLRAMITQTQHEDTLLFQSQIVNIETLISSSFSGPQGTTFNKT